MLLPHQAGAFPGFLSMKWLQVFLPSPPPHGRILVHHRVTQSIVINSPIPIYTPGWREAQCPGTQRSAPARVWTRLLDQGSSELTIRPRRLPCFTYWSLCNEWGWNRSGSPSIQIKAIEKLTAVKRKNLTALPVFAASNFVRVWRENLQKFVGKCYKNSTVRENYKLGVSEDVDK